MEWKKHCWKSSLGMGSFPNGFPYVFRMFSTAFSTKKLKLCKCRYGSAKVEIKTISM